VEIDVRKSCQKKRKENKKIISCGWPFSIMQSARNKPQSSPVSGEDGVVGGRCPLSVPDVHGH